MAAAGHAFAAFVAGGACWSYSAEVWVFDGFLWFALVAGFFAEEDADWCHAEGVADSHGFCGLFEEFVGVGHCWVVDNAEHAAGLVVVGGEFVFPVGDVGPLWVVEVGAFWFVEGVGVVEGAATDAGSCEDHDVVEEVDALDAEASDVWCPEEVAEVPGGFGEFVVCEAASGFDDSYSVAFFGEAEGADGAAESGADDEYVVVCCGCSHGFTLALWLVGCFGFVPFGGVGLVGCCLLGFRASMLVCQWAVLDTGVTVVLAARVVFLMRIFRRFVSVLRLRRWLVSMFS